MDSNILIQQTIANWQWYHAVAVFIGSVLCIIIGVLLVAYFAPWIFVGIYSKFFRR